MRPGLASTGALLGLGAAFALSTAYSVLWPGPAEVWQGLAARQRHAALTAALHRLAAENDVLNAVAGRVAAGELSLREAADEVAPLLLNPDGSAGGCRFAFRSRTPREGAARYLVTRVERLLADDPAAAADAAARLEAELWAIDPGPGDESLRGR